MTDTTRTTAPLVVVCLRPADPATRVDPLTGHIERDPGALDLPAVEAAALEHALRIAQAWSGRVLAVTAGDESADAALRQVMALGVEVLRVPWPAASALNGHGCHGAPAGHGGHGGHGLGRTGEDYAAELVSDEHALARALAAAIRGTAGRDRQGHSVGVGEHSPALVVCGDRSAERGTGALPAFLAHELGAAQALGLVRLEPADGHLLAERRLDGGRKERLWVPLPAVCSVEAAGVRLRRAGLPGVLAAATAEVPVVAVHAGVSVNAATATAAPDGVETGRARPYRPPARAVPPPAGASPRERLLQLSGARVAHDPPTVIGPVGAAEAADALLDFLRRTGHLPETTDQA